MILQNKAEDVLAKDRKYVWHHITPYNEEVSPTVAVEAEGSWITDINGKRYLDAMAGLWCVNVGYGREELAEAAYEQLKTMPYFPLAQSHLPAIQLAEKLNEWLEGEYVIFFSNSGSDANETAFKIARQYHEQNGEPSRYKFISRYRAYHGNSMGALAATGQAVRKYKYEPLAPGFVHVRPPDSYRRPAGQSVEEFNLQCAQAIEDTIVWEGKETVAAVIMEPAITGGGIIVPHPVYMEKVQEICNKHGVLLIIDEVICGFGRTGKKFGHMHFNVKPDIVTMAKGLTSGYLPLSATAVRKDIYEAFKKSAEYGYFRHVNTFGGNPAACALALKNLEIMEKEALVERGRILGERLLEEMKELEAHPYVGDIRSFGFLLGIELVEDKATKEPASAARVGQVIAECKANGLIIGKNGDTVAGFNNVIALSPPLSATDEDLEFIVTTLKAAINKLI
ncbi:aspartate aminotransferase family protein [Aneurinibacillus migulanus]|uniref:Aminotransferase n=1 Tax=Aneurinibacillus migulanus TaxID=47500 RepID=A0A0D1XN44_ANEMI|nr:aspartate aminotransferase family protein [Aneurinibacillus migulanus]KIV55796.1 aminotransferase [Aneurinibacillus migulanus]KON95573.1 aminotransferase [Aneurinibacillus migulanus]MCP1355811.1 aspartate aminotransferase family protein [Aneurinibacillus migulanus]MED0891618.1 aspartate aminotransferase family protein [Aneurinibacillus migulanus]MED1617642.1 aspartate aminotransferase family protein [Aneurinibacillus migulanus]